MKKGFRADKNALNKKTKAHVKAFYTIMDDMQKLAEQLDPSLDYNEENINDYVCELYRDLDPMEKFVLLGKIHRIKEPNIREEFYGREQETYPDEGGN